MAVPRRPGVRVTGASTRPVQRTAGWREHMAERLARSAPRLSREVEQQAACSGMDVSLFYPHESNLAAVERAKDVCRSCPVMRECLSQALRTNDQHAILGATTPDERRKIRRRVSRLRAEAGAVV